MPEIAAISGLRWKFAIAIAKITRFWCTQGFHDLPFLGVYVKTKKNHPKHQGFFTPLDPNKAVEKKRTTQKDPALLKDYGVVNYYAVLFLLCPPHIYYAVNPSLRGEIPVKPKENDVRTMGSPQQITVR